MAHNSFGDVSGHNGLGNPAIDGQRVANDRIKTTNGRSGADSDLAWETELFNASNGMTFGLDGRKKPDPQTSLEMFEQEISSWDQPPKSSGN